MLKVLNRSDFARPRRLVAALTLGFLASCGGGGSDELAQTQAPSAQQNPVQSNPNPPPATPSVSLPPPILSFNDTGLNISDGVTFNGLWSVTGADFGWEYSLDQGKSWAAGSGDSFKVEGDGAKIIWVRSRDAAGNTSPIVMVNCTLDTQAPQSVAVSPVVEGVSRKLQIAGLEPGAIWAYSFDEQATWRNGVGQSLSVLGNKLSRVWLRQVDLAGNVSMPQAIVLEQPGDPAWHEASGRPLQPSLISAAGSRTLLIHGEVVRGDADYVNWEIPAGHRLASVRLVRYVSDDAIAFYAIQRSAVFDAGTDVNRMLVYGHMGPTDLQRNVVDGLALDNLSAGPMTLWFQQTGTLATQYAIEVIFEVIP